MRFGGLGKARAGEVLTVTGRSSSSREAHGGQVLRLVGRAAGASSTCSNPVRTSTRSLGPPCPRGRAPCPKGRACLPERSGPAARLLGSAGPTFRVWLPDLSGPLARGFGWADPTRWVRGPRLQNKPRVGGPTLLAETSGHQTRDFGPGDYSIRVGTLGGPSYREIEIGFRFFENQFLKVVLEKWFRYEFSKTLVRSSKPAGRTRVGSTWLCGQKCNG